MSNEERPRLSLRLRLKPDEPSAPTASPVEAQPTTSLPAATPAPVPAAAPSPRLRMPSSVEAAPAAPVVAPPEPPSAVFSPPTPPVPPPVPFAETPVVPSAGARPRLAALLSQPAEAPVPVKPPQEKPTFEPPPLPVSPAVPPAMPAPAPLRMRAPDAPSAALRPGASSDHGPAVPPRPLATQPKSSAGVGVTLGLLVLLLIGGGAYVYFQDPFGLFVKPAPAPVNNPPAAVVPAPAPATKPLPEAKPVPAAPVATTNHAPVAATKPEPVAATPPKADPAPVASSTPAEPPPPPPPPKPDPAVEKVVAGLVFSGARPNSSGGIIMIGGKVFQPGSTIDRAKGLVFVGFENGIITFRDPAGATYTRRF